MRCRSSVKGAKTTRTSLVQLSTGQPTQFEHVSLPSVLLDYQVRFRSFSTPNSPPILLYLDLPLSIIAASLALFFYVHLLSNCTESFSYSHPGSHWNTLTEPHFDPLSLPSPGNFLLIFVHPSTGATLRACAEHNFPAPVSASAQTPTPTRDEPRTRTRGMLLFVLCCFVSPKGKATCLLVKLRLKLRVRWNRDSERLRLRTTTYRPDREATSPVYSRISRNREREKHSHIRAACALCCKADKRLTTTALLVYIGAALRRQLASRFLCCLHSLSTKLVLQNCRDRPN